MAKQGKSPVLWCSSGQKWPNRPNFKLELNSTQLQLATNPQTRNVVFEQLSLAPCSRIVATDPPTNLTRGKAFEDKMIFEKLFFFYPSCFWTFCNYFFRKETPLKNNFHINIIFLPKSSLVKHLWSNQPSCRGIVLGNKPVVERKINEQKFKE